MLEKKRFIILRIIITNIITLFLPASITLVYTVPAVKDLIRELLKSINVLSIVKQYQILIVIVALLVIPFISSVYSIIKATKKDSSNEEFLFGLLSHIDTIVGCKNKRYSDFLNGNTSIDKSKIFDELIHPILQMNEILKNIISFFELVKKDSTIKCSLIKRDNDGRLDYFIYLDGEPTTNIDLINQSDSTASICCKQRKIVIVEDTDKKDAKFVHSNGTTSINKSIICYPVIKGSKINYVISVTSRNPSTFLNKDKKKYDYALEQFSKRLNLETYLECIKEKAYEQS